MYILQFGRLNTQEYSLNKGEIYAMAEYKKNFSTTAINTGGRDGKSYLEDGTYEVTITAPGSKRDGANPEELFGLGYSACFHSAFDAVKGQEDITSDSVVTLTVSLLENPEDALDLKLQIEIEAGIDGMDAADVQPLIERAHKICPYSRAIENGHVEVSVKAVPYEK